MHLVLELNTIVKIKKDGMNRLNKKCIWFVNSIVHGVMMVMETQLLNAIAVMDGQRRQNSVCSENVVVEKSFAKLQYSFLLLLRIGSNLTCRYMQGANDYNDHNNYNNNCLASGQDKMSLPKTKS